MNGSFRPAARLLAAVLSLLIVGNIVLMAQTAASQSTRSVGASSLPIGQNLEFLENKGQVRDEQGRPVDAVRFTAHSNSSKLFFMPDRIAHVFYTIEGPAARYEPGKGVSSKELDQTRLRYQRVDMELVGANKNVNLRAEGLLPGVTNFFTASAGPDGITGVRSFSTIIYENVYPNIDLVLKARGKGMKAEFIVRPGGDPSLIKLRYTGAERIDATADGGYRIVTNLGTMTEDAPYSFIRTATGQEQELAVRFRVDGETVSFDVPPYDRSQTLVIDPNRDWGTLHGGNQEDQITGVATQRSFAPSGTTPYIYVCGFTAGGTFPVVAASQGTYGGGIYDAFVAAYQYGGAGSSGARQYSTYYGGGNDDRAYGITADGGGQVWIVGQTRSAAWTGGAFTNTQNGDIDGFVARFNASGVPQSARFIGGAADDYLLAVAYDGTNLTVGGYTASPGLATAGVFQTTYNGLYCGMIARVPATTINTVTWLTYYGNNTGAPNSQETYVTSLAPRGTTGGVWVGGFTNSPNTGNAIATTGSFNTVVNNNGSGTSTGSINYDGFVALITSSGGRTASTYYGAVQQDRVLGVAHDPITDGVIAVGRTNSLNTAGNLLASTSGFNTVLNNGTNNTAFEDGFVVRLTVSGTTMNRDWGSYWGSTGDDYLTSVAVDDNNVTAVSPNTAANGTGGKIFVAGTTNQSSGAFTSYNFDLNFNSNQGGFDAVWSRINRTAPAVEYSAIIGSSGNDIAAGIAVDNQRNVFVAGAAGAAGGTMTAPANFTGVQTTYGGGVADGFLSKWCDLIVPNAPEYSTTGEGGTFSPTVSVCQSLNSTATGFVTSPGAYPNVAPGTTYGACPPSAVQTLTVRLTNAVQGVAYSLWNNTSSAFINITPGTGTSAVNATTVRATQDGTIYVSISAPNLPGPGSYELWWVASNFTTLPGCRENGVSNGATLTVNSLPGNDAISQSAPGTDNNSAAAPGSTFNFYVCGGSTNTFGVATAGLTYQWCVMQNGAVTTAPTVANTTSQNNFQITPNTSPGQRDTLYLRVRLTNASGCAIEYQAALYVLPVVSIQNGIANEATNASANPTALCALAGGGTPTPAHSFQDSGPHSLVNTYGNATTPGSGATGGDPVTATTQSYAWTAPTLPAGVTGVTFANPSSANGGSITLTGAPTANPGILTVRLTESYSGGGVNGCSRFQNFNVNLYPQPTATVTPSPAGPVCEGTNVTFTIAVTPASITSGTFSVTLNASSQTGAAIVSGSGVSGGTFGGTTYTGNFSSNPFTLTVNPGTVTAAYDVQGTISLTLNSLTNGASPVSCGLASPVTSASVTITQNPDPITSFQQAPSNTVFTPPSPGPFTSSQGPDYGTVQPPTSPSTGTSFSACVYDATNGYGQEYTYTIVSPAPNAGANNNDNYTWTLPGGTTLVAGGGTQPGSTPPFVTVQYTTPGPKIFTVTQFNNQAPGTCQTQTSFTVNVNPLPASGGTINWDQANWCENQTITFTITGGPPNAQVEVYGLNEDANSGGPTYTLGTGLPIVTTLGLTGNSGTLSFNSGTLSGGTPPTYVDISVAVVVVDQNGCGRVGPSAPGQLMRSISTRVWDTPANPAVSGPDPVCPNKLTNPNAIIQNQAQTVPVPGAYTYTVTNLSAYPLGTTFQWRLLDNSSNVLTPGVDYNITLQSSGGYVDNEAQVRFGKHLDAVSPLTWEVSVTFPSSSGGCTLPFTPAINLTVNAETYPDVVTQTNLNGDANAIASLNLPGLCSGQQAIYAAVPGMSSYQWAIDVDGANNNSPTPYSPTFIGSNTTQTVTIDWPAFSDVPLRWPRVECYVQNANGCVEGDTVTVYILPVPDGSIVQAESPLTGPCVYNGEDSHIEAFTFVPTPNPPGFTVTNITWSLQNGLGAVYSYSSSGASWLSPGVNDTVRFQFYSAGTEVVQATVTSSGGCSNVFTFGPFTIYPPPSPQIFGPTSVCHNSTHQYQVTPYISGDSYYWDITPNDPNNVIASPTSHITDITWGGNPNTTYTLRMIQVSAQGCSARVNYAVTVNPNPQPSINGPSPICAGQQYTYTTQDNSPNNSYVWSFIGTNTAGASFVSGANTAAATITTTTTGSFTIRVDETVTATSCTGFDTKTVTVDASPTPSISRVSPSGPLGQACVGQTVTYQTAASSNNYQWSVTSGGTITGASTNNSVNIQWTATGTQTITLVETIPGSGCSTTVQQQVNVVPQPTPTISGPSAPCSGTDFSYTYQTANNAGSTYSWTLGTGVNAIGPITNASVTVYFSNNPANTVNRTLQVTETNSANCTVTSATLNVTVTSTPQPIITGTNTICQGQSANYSLTGASILPPATTYNWSVTGGTITSANTNNNVDILWTTAGSQTITLVAANGSCSKTVTYNVTVNAAPQAFTVGTTTPTACTNVPNNVTITLSGSQPGVTYTLNRSPGGVQGALTGTGNPLSFTQSVTTAGTYQYTITADDGTCTSTMNGTATVVVNAPPTPLVGGPSPVCANGSTATYSVTPVNGGSTYTWSVTGSGNSVVSQTGNQATIQWNTDGSQTVTVTETDVNGCVGTGSLTVTVSAPPTVFNVTPANASICLPNSGTTNFTVNLSGSQTGVNYQVMHGSNPLGSAVAGTGSAITLTITVGPGGNIVSTGTYNLTVRATATSGGCANIPVTMNGSVNLVVNPTPSPVVNGPTTVCSNQNYTYFTTQNSGSVYNWSVPTGWTINAGQGSYTINVTSGTSGGNITVTETVSSTGCSATSPALAVTVVATPNPTITGSTTPCAGSTQTYTTTAGFTSYSWSISPASAGTIQSGGTTNSATILWGNNAVSATVTVTVANGSCVGTGSLAVNVQAAPQVFNVGTTTPTACTDVLNNVTITLSGSQSGVTYTINRSPGGVQGTLTGTGNPLSFIDEVNTAGTYQYTITADDGTCTSTMNGTATVVVNASPTAGISSGPSEVCSGSSATYAATPASGVTYAWSVSPGNSVQSTTANQATILFGMSSGTATVTVVVTDGNGCTGTASQPVTVNALPLDRPVSISPSSICAAGGVSANVTSATITVGDNTNPVEANTTYELILSGNVVSSTTTGVTPPATVTFTVGSLSAGTYVYSVRAISTTTPACTTVMTQTATLTVNALPTPAVTGPTTPCVGQTVTYTTANNTGSTYSWSWSADFSASGPLNTYQLTGSWTASGSKTVTVTETNAAGCGQSHTLSVTVTPQITTTVSGATAVCSGGTATYTATPTSGVTYAWSVSGTGNSVQSTTANQATILFGMSSGTATVTVVVTDGNGCTGTASQNVTVNALPLDRPVSISPSSICAAGGVPANVTSATITVGDNTNSVEANTTYELILSGNVVSSTTTGATPPATVTFTVGSLSAGTYVYSVRAISTTTPACTTVMTQTATLTVNALPTPAVTGPTSPCEGAAVTYQTTNNTGSTYSWSTSGAAFLPSGPMNTYQLTGTWTGTGPATVTVTETNAAGCGQSNTLNVNVTPAPTPVITASQANPICGGATVTFTTTPAGANSYTWTVGANGTLVSGQGSQSIVTTWANSGSSYSSSVSVVVNVGGCTGTATYTVNVNPQATPNITGPTAICTGQSGTYTTPLTTGRTYTWNMLATPPGMIFTPQTGTNLNSITVNWVNTSVSPFVARLEVVESAAGVCTGRDTIDVTVNPLPNTAITGPTSVCQNQTVTYSHSPALTGHSFAWTVTNAQSWSGQGTGAITVTWGNTNGTVALTVTNNSTGCSANATNSPLAVTVNPNPTPTISGNATPCAGSMQTYSTQGNMTSYQWSITPVSAGTIIGASTSSSVTIQWSNTAQPAQLTVQVNNNGCVGSQTINIDIKPKPTPAISGAAQTCPGVDQAYTTPYTAGNSYSWTISYTPGFTITAGSLSSNTVTVRFNSPGASSLTATLTVTETSPFGCQGTATHTVTVQPAPTPVITGNTNVCGYLAQYDGEPINNTETYVVSDANGIDYTTANIVWTLPFGGGTFTGASSGTGVTAVTVQWDEPTAAATVGRRIAVQVTLGPPTNCSGQTSQNVQVNWNPKPSISGPRAWCDNSPYSANSTVNVSQSGLATYSVQVPVTPVLPDGSSRTYNWTIEPSYAGTVVSGQGTPTVQVSWTSNLDNTPVNATLRVTETINYINTTATPTNKFCGITDTFNVVINPIPKPVITSPDGGITGPNGIGPCGRTQYTYQVAADANSTYQWVVSGGTIIGASTGNSVVVQWNDVTIATAGYVGVTQTFQSPATMCSTYVQQNVTIHVRPTPVVTGPTVLCQQTTNGTNIGMYYTVQTVISGRTYQWSATPPELVIATSIGGSQGQNFTVTWGGNASTPLTAQVTVIETDPASGCSDQYTLNVTLNPNPTPVITSTTGGLNPNGVCAGSTHIYATQFNAGNSYLWTVTGGTISGANTNNQVTVVWGSAGPGTISVREQVGAMFGSGCWTEVTANITIQPLPNPVIQGPATVCRYTEQIYTTLVAVPSGSNTYQWAITNGEILSGGSSPTVTVRWWDTPSGTISVTETTPPSQGSCSNTATLAVTINPKPEPVISGPPAPPVCVNSTQTYSTPLNTGNTYQWTVSGGTIVGVATNNTVNVTWTTVGNGTISVKETNPLGCDTTVSRTIPVNALPSVTITPSGPTVICNGQSLTLLATPGFVSYSWNTGETTPNIVVTQTGTYTVTVVDQNGCSNTSIGITVTVQNVPVPQIQASGPTTFCQGGSVTLSVTGTNIEGYAWSNGATTSSITVTTSGSYWCEVTYNNGCKARTEIINVTVVPRPSVSITANGPTTFCEGGSVVLDAGAGFATYAWSDGSQTVGNNRTLTVTQSGTYTVTVTNNIGCSATSQPVTVTVHPKPAPQIQASGPTEFCEGGSVTLDAGAGYASYSWSNGATTRTITVTQQGTYTVTVTDGNNCSGSSQPVTVTVYPRPAKPTITQTGGTLTSSVAAEYQWYYNGQPISGATERSYTLIRGRDQSGNYKVRIRDNNGCENESDEIYIDITPVEIAGDDSSVRFVPNPTSGELRIIFGDATTVEHARVVVRNLVGRDMITLDLGSVSGGTTKTLDLGNLPNGVYLIEVTLSDGRIVIGRVTKVD